MPRAKCGKSTERTVDFYLTECSKEGAAGPDLSVYDGFLGREAI